jgi:Family of unknown function (DUF5317)
VLLLLSTMIVLGLLIGFAARGTINGLKELHFRAIWVLFASLVVGLLPLFSDSINKHRHPLQLASFAGVLIFLVVNLLTARGEIRAAFLVVALGWALNFIVIAANHGMPLSRWAYAASGQAGAITVGKSGFYRIVIGGPHTKLYRLGDVIPIKPYHVVVSIGDVLMIVGIALIIAAGMRLVMRGAPVEQRAQ